MHNHNDPSFDDIAWFRAAVRVAIVRKATRGPGNTILPDSEIGYGEVDHFSSTEKIEAQCAVCDEWFQLSKKSDTYTNAREFLKGVNADEDSWLDNVQYPESENDLIDG